jgi:cytochrome c-type biogenesis protein CcmH/NrfG
MFNIGVALVHGKNDLTGALQYWERMVETNPNDPQINLVKEQIRLVKEQLSRQ